MRIRVTLLTIAFLTMAVHISYSQNYIYRVVIDGFRVQTGFKANGINGIVTALHGVAVGKGNITIQEFSTQRVFNNVKIAMLDMANDICTISSPQIAAIPLDQGYTVNNRFSDDELKGKTVRINGYPLGIFAMQDNNVLLDNNKPIVPLQTIIPPGIAPGLLKRNSPNTNIRVLVLNGTIAPGHSGAPIIYNKEVIGMADGGLTPGISGYAWAVILKNVSFVTFRRTEDFMRITHDNGNLLSYEYSPRLDSIATKPYNPCLVIDSIINECKNSFITIIGNEKPRGHYILDALDETSYQDPQVVTDTVSAIDKDPLIKEIPFEEIPSISEFLQTISKEKLTEYKTEYYSKANYLGSVTTEIFTSAKIANIRVGTLVCLLSQIRRLTDGESRGYDLPVQMSDGYTSLGKVYEPVDFKSLRLKDEYKTALNNYLLAKTIIKNCLAERISSSIEKKSKEGNLSFLLELKKDDISMELILKGNGAFWDIFLAFNNNLAFQKEKELFQNK
jgi:hypothetical protein